MDKPREILFRGKRIASDEWVEGSLLDYGDGDFDICVPCVEEGGLYKYCVRPETVGQYTGKKDFNKKRIFEGDILRFYDDDGNYCHITVFWDETQTQWATRQTDRGTVDKLENFDAERSEVVGNIHDNPELLEAGS